MHKAVLQLIYKNLLSANYASWKECNEGRKLKAALCSARYGRRAGMSVETTPIIFYLKSGDKSLDVHLCHYLEQQN